MKKSQYIKQINLERVTCRNLVWHIIIITIIMFIALYNVPKVTEKEGTSKVSESCSNKTTTPYMFNFISKE